MDTLLLDTKLWDICLDSYGNLALATDPYSAAQDVASAVRTFLGECWYNTSIGIPYYQQVLGQSVPLSLIKNLIKNAALTVPGVSSPIVFITSFVDRSLKGQIQFIDTNVSPNTQVVVGFGPGLFYLGGQVGGPQGPIQGGSSLGGLNVI